MTRLLFIGGHRDGHLDEVERPGHPFITLERVPGELLDERYRQVVYYPFEFGVLDARVMVMLVEGTTFDHGERFRLAIEAICKRADVELRRR